jgi:E3 ubiquitin-protein ligase DOA10
MADAAPAEEKQCRICLDTEVEELGRLIRPCLCKGSISVSHDEAETVISVTDAFVFV